MRVRVVNTHKDKSRLRSMAESVGSTLGIIAAKANVVAGLGHLSPASSSRSTDKPSAKARKFGSLTQKSPPPNPTRGKSAGKARRSLGGAVAAGRKPRPGRARSQHR